MTAESDLWLVHSALNMHLLGGLPGVVPVAMLFFSGTPARQAGLPLIGPAHLDRITANNRAA